MLKGPLRAHKEYKENKEICHKDRNWGTISLSLKMAHAEDSLGHPGNPSGPRTGTQNLLPSALWQEVCILHRKELSATRRVFVTPRDSGLARLQARRRSTQGVSRASPRDGGEAAASKGRAIFHLENVSPSVKPTLQREGKHLQLPSLSSSRISLTPKEQVTENIRLSIPPRGCLQSCRE